MIQDPPPDQRAAVLRDYDDATAGPPISDRRPLSCVVALLALGLLVLFPWLVRTFSPELPRPAVLAITAILVLLVLGGVVYSVFGGALMRGNAMGEAEEALAHLCESYPSADPDEDRRAAVRLLANAFISSGPTTVSGFDFDSAAARLGPALEFVKAVERVLRQERQIYAVFTLDE